MYLSETSDVMSHKTSHKQSIEVFSSRFIGANGIDAINIKACLKHALTPSSMVSSLAGIIK